MSQTGMCLKCGHVGDMAEHTPLHNLEKGDRVRATLEDGATDIVAVAEVTKRFEHPEHGSSYMFRFIEIREDGVDRTEHYIDEIGAERGIPEKDMNGDEFEVLE